MSVLSLQALRLRSKGSMVFILGHTYMYIYRYRYLYIYIYIYILYYIMVVSCKV